METHPYRRARARRTTYTAVTAAAVVSLTALTACGSDAPPRPTAASSVKPCLTASGDLLADVDNDGHPDRVSDPSRTGKQLSIAFGNGSGYGKPVGLKHLVGSTGDKEHDVLAAVADFDGDGWSDLLVAVSGDFEGDDPVKPRVAEIRLGPFSASGHSRHTRHLDLGDTHGVRVADDNHDHYPDLATYTYTGDGVYDIQERLGSRTETLGNKTAGDDQPADVSPDDLPRSGLSTFYPPCDSSRSGN